MVKSSPWPKLLPPLGVILGLVLAAAVGSLWLVGGDSTAGLPGGEERVGDPPDLSQV